MEKQIFCTNCGQSNNASSRFCQNCGSKLNNNADSGSINLNKDQSDFYNTREQSYLYSEPCDYDKSERDLFIQKNQIFYNEKFRQMESKGKKESWNWSAFLLGFYWFLYRKMYAKGFLYLLAGMVGYSIPYIGWIINLALWIGVGIYSNSLYLDHINKKFIEIKNATYESREELILSKGGTNLLAPIILAVVVPVIVFILLFSFILEFLYWI